MTGHIEGPDERRQAQHRAGIGRLAEPRRHDGQRRQDEGIDTLERGIDLGTEEGAAAFGGGERLARDAAIPQEPRADVIAQSRSVDQMAVGGPIFRTDDGEAGGIGVRERRKIDGHRWDGCPGQRGANRRDHAGIGGHVHDA